LESSLEINREVQQTSLSEIIGSDKKEIEFKSCDKHLRSSWFPPQTPATAVHRQ